MVSYESAESKSKQARERKKINQQECKLKVESTNKPNKKQKQLIELKIRKNSVEVKRC